MQRVISCKQWRPIRYGLIEYEYGNFRIFRSNVRISCWDSLAISQVNGDDFDITSSIFEYMYFTCVTYLIYFFEQKRPNILQGRLKMYAL